jgi:hypothetical protein
MNQINADSGIPAESTSQENALESDPEEGLDDKTIKIRGRIDYRDIAGAGGGTATAEVRVKHG